MRNSIAGPVRQPREGNIHGEGETSEEGFSGDGKGREGTQGGSEEEGGVIEKPGRTCPWCPRPYHRSSGLAR